MIKKKQIGYRPTWAEINLDNLAFNFHQIRRLVGVRTKIMVTVKADAYGHGLVPVAKRLVKEGADYLGVASIDEGIRLREARVSSPILVLGMILAEDMAPLFKYRLMPTVCTSVLAAALDKKARQLKKAIDVHVKVDTGMGRLGVLHEEAEELFERICRLKHLRLQGIFTHFAFADMNRAFTLYQIRLFNELLNKLSRKGIRVPLVHCANSMGVLRFRSSHFNMVRPGIVLYGLRPAEDVAIPIKVKPVLSLKTRIVYLKRMPAGKGISYGHIYRTSEEATIITLPIGYGDGFPRNLSNKADVLIRGKRFKVSGRVCMDHTMVDVGDLKVRIGEEAVLIGAQRRAAITAEELADLCDTIPYEIVCGLGSRIPRIYV